MIMVIWGLSAYGTNASYLAERMNSMGDVETMGWVNECLDSNYQANLNIIKD